MTRIKRHDLNCIFKIDIENVGFARCYQEAVIWLEYIDADGNVCRSELDLTLDRILPGETKTGSCAITPVSGNVYLCAERKKDKTPICFANVTQDQKKILLGKLYR